MGLDLLYHSFHVFNVVFLLTGTAWAPDDDDDDGSYGNLTPPADKSRPSVGTLQLYYTTPPTSVSIDIEISTSKYNETKDF